MQGFFVTGTDTEVGKTYVCIQLIRLLVDEGLKVAAMKPVASGAQYVKGILKNDDALVLMDTVNVTVDYDLVNPFVFEPAIAPHLAAARAGVTIDLKKIKKNYQVLSGMSDVVVVEGAGGWCAPLGQKETIADLAKELALPVILVVGLRLGCINHAILTVKAIQQTGLTVAGWVANHIENNFVCAEENIDALKNFLKDIPFIGIVPFQTGGCHTTDFKKQTDYSLKKQILIKHLN